MSAPVILSAAATKGGVGKTTLIANVSAVLADIGLRVLMIDCDVQPSLSKYYRNHPLDNFQYRFSEFRHCYFQ
ncbi:TPA: ParA family protein [Neisseria gonorrhoeae]